MSVWFKRLSGAKDHSSLPRPTEFVRKLYDAQNGRCFLCNGVMVWGEAAANYRDMGWTRDHVYPKSTHPNTPNNLVLAHPPCNTRKGSRPPTEDEVRRTAELYAAIGRVAFSRQPPTPKTRTKLKMALKVTPSGIQWVEVTS